jgi:hypothetical protein
MAHVGLMRRRSRDTPFWSWCWSDCREQHLRVIPLPRPAHYVDDVLVSAESTGGLRMECGQCGSVGLVLLEQASFNEHVTAFLQWHPDRCRLV